jgi:ectoine hydroxylase-related dioxygenase (phytanoyl-CoA dioxygenase family)
LVEQRTENPRVGGSIPPLATTSIDRDGFAVFERVFDAREMDLLFDALERAPLSRSRAGARHAMQSPHVARLAADLRLLRIVRAVLGPEAVPFRATLFDKSVSSNWLVAWHQDTALPIRERRDVAGWGPWSVKSGIDYARAPVAALDRILALRVHLDDSTAVNGPLRVVPGSHRHGLLTDADAQRLARESEPVSCLVARGGVIAMRPLLLHASSKADHAAPRRVLHIEYAASMQAGDGLQLAVA